MVTLKQVNKAIREAGFSGIELFKADGYCYFFSTSEGMNWLDEYSVKNSTCVMVPRLKDLTVAEWVGELKRMYKEHF